jgi:hypothetical protein
LPKRIAKARQRKVELSEDQIDHLLSGYSLGPEFPFKDEAERRKAWTAHRAELMQYIGRTSGPGFYAQNGIPWGHRPAGWWQFEAPGTRRRIRGDMSITSIGEERSPSGTLRFWSEQVDDSEFETQHQFLKRHGLLSDTEQEQTA